MNKMLNITDFFYKYPSINLNTVEILKNYDDNFGTNIVSKAEFRNLKYENEQSSNSFYIHQKIIGRFLSKFTLFTKLIIFHEMGSGKTCTAISVLEGLRQGFQKAIVCTKGPGLIKNFIQELIYKCDETKKKYQHLRNEKLSIIEKRLNDYYIFTTHEKFSKTISNLSPTQIKKKYENTIFVVDEIHNIHEGLDIYDNFWKLFHNIDINCKILLLSGTIMKDSPSEFASVMNLILSTKDQFPLRKNFIDKFFIEEKLSDDGKEEIKKKIKGLISYVKTNVPNVEKKFQGEKNVLSLKYLTVYPVQMSSFQTKSYNDAYEKDLQTINIYSNSKQASLFVYPDGSYGNSPYYEKNFKKIIQQIQTLEDLKKYSAKFYFTVKSILDEPKKKTFIYSEYVTGGGCVLLAAILNRFGFSEFKTESYQKKKRYILLTRKTLQNKSVNFFIKNFNLPENKYGEYISVVIGSKIVNEGFTFTDIQKEIILTPHWNFSETSQTIARGWRINSHQELLKDLNKVTVEIYLLVVIPDPAINSESERSSSTEGACKSIDEIMYSISEKKDVQIKQIENLIKKNAFDCPLLIEKNTLSKIFDNLRECEYEKCNFKCESEIKTETDFSSYILYYQDFDKIKNFFQTYFNSHKSITLEELHSFFPDKKKQELLYYINQIIELNIPFTYKFNLLFFIRMTDNIIFRNFNIFFSENNVYYGKNLIFESKNSLKKILSEYKNQTSNIIEIINCIFKYPENLNSYIEFLPLEIQKILLQNVILADVLNKSKNINIRNKILDYHKGFFTLDKENKRYLIFLDDEILKLDKNNKWVQDDKKEEILEAQLKKITKLKKNPYGYYGLWNPRLEEFCITKIDLNKPDTDIRKKASGKRCHDWNTDVLLDIVVRKIKLKVPNENKIHDKEKIKKLVSQIKYHKKEDFNDYEILERLIYWSKKTRKVLCSEIYEFFKKNNLIVEDLNCGTQQKKKK
jgi:hypothetical protein